MRDMGPEGELRAATARRKRAERALVAARRSEAHAALRALQAKELRQSEIAQITGYTREHVRRITNEAARETGTDTDD